MAIYQDIEIIVNNGVAKPDKDVYLVRGDHNVIMNFVVVTPEYKIKKTPDNNLLVRFEADTFKLKLMNGDICKVAQGRPIQNNKMAIMFSSDMISKLPLGTYTYQLSVIDEKDGDYGEITFPPIAGRFHVVNPIFKDGDDIDFPSAVGFGLVDISVVAYEEPGPNEIIDENGHYNRKVWINGELITSRGLNSLEAISYMNRESILKKFDDVIMSSNNNVITLDFYSEEQLLKTVSFNVGSSEGEDVNIDLSNYVTKEELNEVDTQVDKNTSDINTILGIIDEPPTYSKPTLIVGANKTSIQHNTSTSITITPTFRQNDAGAVVSYTLYRDNTQVYTNSSVNAYTHSISLAHNQSTVYSATVSYSDGVIKNTLLGIAYPETSIKAGSISNSATVRAYALSYYGVINNASINDTQGLTSVLRSGRGSTLTFNMTNQRVVYMYPKSFGNLTSIKDANNFEYINSYTLSNMTIDGVEYNVYVLTDAVSISGFKQIFS